LLTLNNGEIMKKMYLIPLLFALSSCGKSTEVRPITHEALAEPVAVKMFREVCLNTAPSFNNAEEIANNNGIEFLDGSFMMFGFNKDKSVGVQIKENKECAVTTPSQNSRSLTSSFLDMLGDYLGVKLPKRVPFKAVVKGTKFIFMHDRKGGEAFVMLDPKG
jgi:hypothetical protein